MRECRGGKNHWQPMFSQQKRHKKVIIGFVPKACGNSLIYLSAFIQQIFVEYLVAMILALIEVSGIQ